MLIIMASPNAVLRQGQPDQEIVNLLIKAKADNYPVGLISNHGEPEWFEELFGGSGVQFLCTPSRQDGKIVATNAEKFNLNSHDVLVLATKNEDVQMGKNGGAVLIAAGWSTDTQVKSLGICVDNAQQLQEIIDLSAGWLGYWWFKVDKPRYKVRALADLSSYGKTNAQQTFSKKLTETVKGGGNRLNALLAITARSLLTDENIAESDLLWGVYPSSSSNNDDNEVLSDFTHRLRTTVSRVRFSKRGEPLFIRHIPSSKRSAGGSNDRTDPAEQILTLHLNPYYKEKDRLSGKHVIVIDDCTTYGVSFGVAAAFLRKAGVASVTGVALGKFGNQLGYYEIDILSDPFAPISKDGFSSKLFTVAGINNNVAQQDLRSLIP